MKIVGSFVLLAGIGLTNGQDPACQEAFSSTSTALVLGSDCTETTNGICPSSCESLFQNLHDTCVGKAFQDDDGEIVEYSPSLTLGLAFFITGACEDAPLSVLMSRSDLTCSDWLGVNSYAAIFSCSEGEGCPDSCKQVIDKVYEACKPTSEMVDSSGKVSSAKTTELGASFLRSQECNTYANSLEWQGLSVGTQAPTASPTKDNPKSSAVSSLCGRVFSVCIALVALLL